YIQKDYAADPRQFYYGQKRRQFVQTVSTFQQKPYLRLVERDDKQLIDDRQIGLLKDKEFERLQLYNDLQMAPGSAGGIAAGEKRIITKTGAGELAAVITESRPINGHEEAEFGRSAGRADAIAFAGKEPAVQVRNDFRSTALWRPDVVTDKNGKATVAVKFPDSLTGWTATARVASSGSQFGVATASARTKQPLIVRLEAPRFFVVGDSVTVSAVINNNTH